MNYPQLQRLLYHDSQITNVHCWISYYSLSYIFYREIKAWISEKGIHKSLLRNLAWANWFSQRDLRENSNSFSFWIHLARQWFHRMKTLENYKLAIFARHQIHRAKIHSTDTGQKGDFAMGERTFGTVGSCGCMV